MKKEKEGAGNIFLILGAHHGAQMGAKWTEK